MTALANSLLVRNEAANGSAFSGNSANFINTTIADNEGVAIFPRNVPLGPLLPGAPASFSIKLSNSIVSGTWTAPCAAPTAATPFADGGNNLQFPGQSCGTTITTAYPFLGAYYVPVFWSPALNHGNPAICAAAPISRKDVYNVRRPLGQAACAIGAVEGDIDHLLHRWRGRMERGRTKAPVTSR